jgi:hypothetical protein
MEFSSIMVSRTSAVGQPRFIGQLKLIGFASNDVGSRVVSGKNECLCTCDLMYLRLDVPAT